MADEMIRKTIKDLAEIYTRISLKFPNCKIESEKIDRQFFAFVNYVKKIHGIDGEKLRKYEDLYEESKKFNTKI